MTDFYEPVQLFRQNAIRSKQSGESLRQQLTNDSSRGVDAGSASDTLVLDRTIGQYDQDKLASSYWKIGDEDPKAFTSLDTLTIENSHTLAIGSAATRANLLIYNIAIDTDEDFLLTHKKTISLPNIHALKWLNPVDIDDDHRFLLSGHTNGYINLTMIPEYKNTSASIVKRFNHAKHVEYRFPATNTTIDNLTTTPTSWRTCTLNSILSSYSNNIFLWDSSRSSIPVIKMKIKDLNMFDASATHESLLGLAGEFGISLLDLRSDRREFYKPGNSSTSAANLVSWNPTNEHLVASAHLDNTVQVWDIRNSSNPMSSLVHGHKDQITSLQWDGDNIISASKDGSIVNWDMSFENHVEGQQCTLRQGLSSVFLKTNEEGFIVEDKKRYASIRQCGTQIPASNNAIVSLAQINQRERSWTVSIDETSFLGVHGKRTEQYHIASDPTTPVDNFHSFEERPLFDSALNKSNSTLVESEEPLQILTKTEPLNVGKIERKVSGSTLASRQKQVERKTSESTLVEFVKEQNIPVTMFHNLPYI